jgi:hypothetical protein
MVTIQLYRRETLLGLGLAVTTCIGLALLPAAWARGAAANLLTLIAAIYVGFALASQGRLPLTKQVIGCAFFVTLALLGMWLNWWFLIVGLALHGGWDYLHQGKAGHGVVPAWYIPFCAIYDWMVALFLALFYGIGQ